MMIKNLHSKLWLYFATIVFGIIATSLVFFSIFSFLLYSAGMTEISPFDGRAIPIITLLLFSVIVGTAISIFVGKLIIRPIQKMGRAFKKLEMGDFKIQLAEDNKLREINEISRRFNKMVRELSNIETLRNDFVVNVSHEFKTPIAMIEGYATLLQDETLPFDERARYTAKILDSSRQLTDMSGNILSLSKLENQEHITNKIYFGLDEQIRNAILLLENKWSKKQIDFNIDLPRVSYYGSESLLMQVWFNILDNAIKHSAEHGIIGITIQDKRDNIQVMITDNGSGMSEEVQRHAFEKFYQGDSARKADGNGLGLAIVKRIVDLSGGSVSVMSTVGMGATFTVTLPNHDICG